MTPAPVPTPPASAAPTAAPPADARFTDVLRESVRPAWDRAVDHRFVRELHAGTIPDPVMAGYLVQDHRFLDAFLQLIGGAVATADTPAARLRFAAFAGEVAGEENTYFLRAFEALGVSEIQREAIPDSEATTGFLELFREAAGTREYAAILAVLLVTEWLYLDWARRAPRPLPESFVHAEWIALHDNPGFAEFVDFLRDELDRVGSTSPQRARDLFARTVDLEGDFFDQACARPLPGSGPSAPEREARR
jgi:thiaminase/transcriptional activator TenA